MNRKLVDYGLLLLIFILLFILLRIAQSAVVDEQYNRTHYLQQQKASCSYEHDQTEVMDTRCQIVYPANDHKAKLPHEKEVQYLFEEKKPLNLFQNEPFFTSDNFDDRNNWVDKN